jgi:ribose 5-phosphate isomerase A
MGWVDDAKKRAAESAAAYVKSGYIIGLGSGSTAIYAIHVIGNRLRSADITGVLGVPTSFQAASEAVKAGIPITNLNNMPVLDLAIDGADQINEELNVIKGGGGALLREKIVASASKKYIIVADETKLVENLGDGFPLPIEVLPFALGTVLLKVEKLGGKAVVRKGPGKVGPVITDNGNIVIDADFGEISNPFRLEEELKKIPGVLETGLFLGFVDIACVGNKTEVETLHRPN